MTPQERRAMRREQVERCLSTTMTIKDWCALNGVPESTMYGWMSRFRKEEPELFEKPNAGEWIEVTREAIAAQTALAKPCASVVVKEEAGNLAAVQSGHAGAHDASAIVVSMNGAAVAVPAGSAEADVATVLRAVASL